MERREDEILLCLDMKNFKIYFRLTQSIQYYKLDKSNEQQDKIILTLFQIIMNALMGILFFYYSTHENKYGGGQCKFLRPCAFWFAVYCFFSLFASIVVNPYAIYYKHDQIFDYVNIIEGSMKLIFFILFCIALIISNNCGQLKGLTIIYIMFNIIVFLMLCGLTYFIKPKKEE